MTPEQHNKYLGISHLAYGAFFLLLTGAMMAIFLALIIAVPKAPDDPPPIFFVPIMLLFLVIYCAMMLPSFIAGYGLLKRRKWAKTASIVAGVISGMSFPLGTAVCIYTFWFLFSEPGKTLYDRPAYALPPPPPRWDPVTCAADKTT
jgi:hypothetical protein